MVNFIAWNCVWILACCYLYVAKFEFASGLLLGLGLKAWLLGVEIVTRKEERKNGC